ncbi:hypothetical protein F4809DRAFT_452994 [Biscogniauxia mediterranea]|nr:hypothetical protein F4809DRAFT_452994 [Biscogniauxia mediterranea]
MILWRVELPFTCNINQWSGSGLMAVQPQSSRRSRNSRLIFMGGGGPYGRPMGRNSREGTTDFTGILPNNPFDTIHGPCPGNSNEPLWMVPVLRFWTWRMGLCVTVREQQQPGASGPGEGLCHCNMVDKVGRRLAPVHRPRTGLDRRHGGQVASAHRDQRRQELHGGRVPRVELLYPQEQGRERVRSMPGAVAGEASGQTGVQADGPWDSLLGCIQGGDVV